MNPVNFPQFNCHFGPPEDLVESQCLTIKAFKGPIEGGSIDGAIQVIVAWQPSEQELKDLNEGKPIFFSCLGGLPPHYLSTSFEECRNMA